MSSPAAAVPSDTGLIVLLLTQLCIMPEVILGHMLACYWQSYALTTLKMAPSLVSTSLFPTPNLFSHFFFSSFFFICSHFFFFPNSLDSIKFSSRSGIPGHWPKGHASPGHQSRQDGGVLSLILLLFLSAVFV